MKLIIAANWKMHKTTAEAAAFCAELRSQETDFSGVDVLICPPFTALAAVKEALAGSALMLGAQNMSWETKGAYTGEIAPLMLKELNVSHVIIGHSERRQIMGEDDGIVRKKLRAALEHDLIPILCVGETEAERNRGDTEAVLSGQIKAALEGLEPTAVWELVVAYEPIWAIGTGQAASPDDAAAAAILVRAVAAQCLGEAVAKNLRVQYGGSVNAGNIGEFVSLPPVNGALVGGASLEAGSFSKLIIAAKEASTC